jgi:hypothetical protein
MALLAQHALPHVIAKCGMPRAWCATMHPAARSPIGPVRRKDPLGNAMAGSVSASASTATRTWIIGACSLKNGVEVWLLESVSLLTRSGGVPSGPGLTPNSSPQISPFAPDRAPRRSAPARGGSRRWRRALRQGACASSPCGRPG